MVQISDLAIGQTAVIHSLSESAPPAYRGRLLAMGLLPGTTIKLARLAPLGCPYEIFVRGSSLSVRASEAGYLELEFA